MAAGSITKTFTAAMILQQSEAGLLNLDDPLHRWLENFDHVDSTITIRQLLNHTSGLHNLTNSPAFIVSVLNADSRSWSPEELISTFLLSPRFTPGSEWHYSNTNYLLLGMILENVTGHSYPDLLRSNCLDPAGLLYTHLESSETSILPWVHGWSDLNFDGRPEDINSRDRSANYSAAWSAGALVSTPGIW